MRKQKEILCNCPSGSDFDKHMVLPMGRGRTVLLCLIVLTYPVAKSLFHSLCSLASGSLWQLPSGFFQRALWDGKGCVFLLHGYFVTVFMTYRPIGSYSMSQSPFSFLPRLPFSGSLEPSAPMPLGEWPYYSASWIVSSSPGCAASEIWHGHSNFVCLISLMVSGDRRLAYLESGVGIEPRIIPTVIPTDVRVLVEIGRWVRHGPSCQWKTNR